MRPLMFGLIPTSRPRVATQVYPPRRDCRSAAPGSSWCGLLPSASAMISSERIGMYWSTKMRSWTRSCASTGAPALKTAVMKSLHATGLRTRIAVLLDVGSIRLESIPLVSRRQASRLRVGYAGAWRSPASPCAGRVGQGTSAETIRELRIPVRPVVSAGNSVSFHARMKPVFHWRMAGISEALAVCVVRR
jgi:hypothetical protein